MEQRGRRSVQRRGLDMQSAGTRAREVNYSLCHKLLGAPIPLSCCPQTHQLLGTGHSQMLSQKQTSVL
ncbi:hypothetical protein XELAEV_18003957mg [Xenopus laevis]|uniref:Uncharacterized protein n=1 Tax=Xenopus laevis TaxID=8355 RepID=A0A974BS63_XENLA|nr:hypothetical protein XELAEV_18003957mg [Xenopus laevis]